METGENRKRVWKLGNKRFELFRQSEKGGSKTIQGNRNQIQDKVNKLKEEIILTRRGDKWF